jgi:hypothetical protein
MIHHSPKKILAVLFALILFVVVWHRFSELHSVKSPPQNVPKKMSIAEEPPAFQPSADKLEVRNEAFKNDVKTILRLLTGVMLPEGGASALIHTALYQRTLTSDAYLQAGIFPAEGVSTQLATSALMAAISGGAGARTNTPGSLDPVDSSILAWNDSRAMSAPSLNAVEKSDEDGDGLPDAWETTNGLNYFDAKDANLDSDGNGYSNLEEYLNQYFIP